MKCILIFLFFYLIQGAALSKPPEGMVLVPAGEFTLGTDAPQAPINQRPAREVHLDAFYIDKHEVTNAQFEAFILAGGYNKRKYWTKEGWDFIEKERFIYIYPIKEMYRIETPLGFGANTVSTAPDHPVIGVSWYEAAAYAKWAGKRLPTEAEWEKAARGVSARRYPWGNKMDFKKLLYFPHQKKLLPVGSFPKGASPFGAMDMAGSVWEWCADWYNENDSVYGPEANPLEGTADTGKVLRGGSWDSPRLLLQCTYRAAEPPTHRAYTVGFRCAKDVN